MSKILHGGRLGDVRADVAKFCSSRKDDARLVDAVLAINKAHVVMLLDQKIIQWQDGAKILESLKKQNSQELDTNAEDIHMAVEEAVLSQTGPEVGGNLHIAKSRNDQVATAIRIALRKELLTMIGQLIDLQQALLETAVNHTQTIILEYTHLQAAQPVTFAHYLISHLDLLGRDLKRLLGAYERVNLCPLGACALATTSFPINRERTAGLLGFKDVVENSIDAVGNRDFVVETQGVLALLAVNLSRFAEDLIIWSSAEFATVELPDEFTSTSSIMPQKKNPEVLEIIRARAGYALGDFVASTSALKGLPTTYNLDFQEITPKLWASIDNLKESLGIFAALIPKLKVSEKILQKAASGFVAATEVANMLVSKYDVSFRTSHKIVGGLVKVLIDESKTLKDASPQLLQSVAMKVAGIELTVENEDLVLCTDLRKIIETYKVQGGPSPKEVERVLKERNKAIIENKKVVAQLKDNLADAETLLNKTVEAYASKAQGSVKLKNQN